MKILIYGAGIIGSIYAARLHEVGTDVTLLARGNRYEDLKKHGIILKNVITGQRTTHTVPLIQQLCPDDFFDLVIVTVRVNQVDSIIPVLMENKSSAILLMMNYPDDTGPMVRQLSPKILYLGFPGVGGTYTDNLIDYIQIKQQQTTLGSAGKGNPTLLKEVKTIFEKAAFNPVISENMQAWLKIHAVFMACVCASIIKENGSSIQLGKNKSSVKTMVKSIREGFIACSQLGIPVIPNNLKIIFMVMPQWFSVLYWQKAMQGKTGTLAMAPHANAAMDEMQLVAKKVLEIVHEASSPTPTLDALLNSFINKKY